MAEFVFIQDYSKAGKLGISRKVFEKICSVVTNKISGVSTTDEKKKKALATQYEKQLVTKREAYAKVI